MPPHAIIDLETLDTTPDSIVTEIGAIIYDPEDFCFIEELGIDLDIAEQLAIGRTFSAETIHHRRRNKTLGASKFTACSLRSTVSRLDLLLLDHKPDALWIWGKDFDGPILSSLFRSAQRDFPIPYYQRHCARDRYKLAFGTQARGTTKPHSALEDCRISLADLKAANERLCLIRKSGVEP